MNISLSVRLRLVTTSSQNHVETNLTQSSISHYLSSHTNRSSPPVLFQSAFTSQLVCHSDFKPIICPHRPQCYQHIIRKGTGPSLCPPQHGSGVLQQEAESHAPSSLRLRQRLEKVPVGLWHVFLFHHIEPWFDLFKLCWRSWLYRLYNNPGHLLFFLLAPPPGQNFNFSSTLWPSSCKSKAIPLSCTLISPLTNASMLTY